VPPFDSLELGYGFLFDFYSNCGRISYRFRHTLTYWSKIAHFLTPSVFGASVRGKAIGVKQMTLGDEKLE